MGVGDQEFFVASDVPAILEHTRDVSFWLTARLPVMTRDGIRVTDFSGKEVKPEKQRITWDPIQVEKGGFKHFMLKRFTSSRAPSAKPSKVASRTPPGRVFLDQMKNISEDEFKRLTSIKIAACGTSLHAGLAGKYMIEQLARVNVK
jgi:glucosamine--fructose-6-phosphate aminotransferase (isomerizing)